MTTATATDSARDTFGFDIDSVPERYRDRVRALIPNPAFAAVYVSRTIDGVNDLAAFAGHLEERENLLLVGPASSGKTFAPQAFAAAHGLPFVAVNVNGGIDPGIMWGETKQDPNDPERIEFVPSDLLLVVWFGGVILVDEINMAHERITAMFHEMTADTRRVTVPGLLGHSYPVAFPSLIVGTMNPPGGAAYRGTRELNGALNDRFVTIPWPYDREVESALVRSTSLLDLADNIRALPDVVTPLGTRALMQFERSADRFGVPYAVGRLVARFRESERAGVRRAVEMATAAISADLADPVDNEEGDGE